MADLSTAIEEAAAEPQSATIDNQSATARPIADLIEADRYLKTKTATANGRSGWGSLRQARVVPPGAVQ